MASSVPPFRADQHRSFLRVLESLNPSQQAAVNHIEGPVLVIAGPGTGKTHILTARIGRILQKTDTPPASILCLTFTDAGVRAMRERLMAFIGPTAHRVHIYTFHSFCNTVIQDNLEFFGHHDLEPISELERIGIIRKLIDQLEVDHPLYLRPSYPYFYERHLEALFKKIKQEGWSVSFVMDRIQTYIEDLPSREEFRYKRNYRDKKKGDIKDKALKKEIDKMSKLREAVRLFEKYEEALKAHKRYEYEDMIRWVRDAFAEDENLLRYYQERYLYFLVDEYQDTNGAQNDIIGHLISYWENPNIFIVGDDDQSIYEFQGARLKNLSDFYREYKGDLELVVLTENYRSTQRILDASGRLINFNQLRIVNKLSELDIEKKIFAALPVQEDATPLPRITEFPNRLQEDISVLQQIEKWKEAGVRLSEMAVIYARHKQGRRILELLQKKEIPYQVRRKINILHLPLIRQLRQMMEYLGAEAKQPFSGEHLLFKILHFPCLGISPIDIARLSIYLREEDGSPSHWREVIGRPGKLQEAGITNTGSFLAWYALIEEMLLQSEDRDLPSWMEKLINRSGMLKYVMTGENRAYLLQLLFNFTDFLKGEVDRNPHLRLNDFLKLLDQMDANRLSLDLHYASQREEGVHLLTAHSAKGLEFDRVFIIDCIDKYWEPSNRNSSFSFSLPDTLTYSGEEDEMEARRRLLYVAMTRAKTHLQISYAHHDERDRELQRAVFIDELVEADGKSINFEKRQLEEVEVTEAQALLLSEGEGPRLPVEERVQVEEILSNFKLSISSLNQYLKCPLGFYYRYLLKVPLAQSDAALYGTVVHRTLQRYFERGNDIPASEELLLRFFRQEMEKRTGKFSRSRYGDFLERGSNILQAFLQQEKDRFSMKTEAELTIRNMEINGVPVEASLDLVEFPGEGQLRIVDFKTGSYDSKRLRRASEKEEYGGSFWRQLLFYKVLLEEYDRRDRSVTDCVLIYLEPEKDGSFQVKTLQYNAQDERFMKDLISETNRKIRSGQFFQGCGESDCQWCQFMEDRMISDSFSDPEIEELDDP
ncbi:MAG: ATP-dependent DNA helicase [Saprospiraceae bacterium]|nr:ATP-dependent DNA helicase [Saprospiraceae bacterium]